MTVKELADRLAVISKDKGDNAEIFLQLGNHEHPDIPLAQVRAIKFAGKIRIFLQFQ